MTPVARLLLCGLALAPGVPALGAEPILPVPSGAEVTARNAAGGNSHAFPVGPWEAGKVPFLTLSGPVSRTAWRMPGQGGDTLALTESLRAALVAEGYGVVFACATDACGGFDFRYAIDLLPEPEMHVDLADFRYLTAVKGVGPTAEYVGLMVSRAGETGFVELTYLGGQTSAPPDPALIPVVPDIPEAPEPAAPVTEAPDPAGLAERLEAQGHVILEDVRFASGSADLAADASASLEAIALYLEANPQATILIVGHTDASGSLGSNIALSTARASAVVDRLVADYGADPARLGAQGAGPLAPITTNLSQEGREKNRRVEAVLTSTR